MEMDAHMAAMGDQLDNATTSGNMNFCNGDYFDGGGAFGFSPVPDARPLRPVSGILRLYVTPRFPNIIFAEVASNTFAGGSWQGHMYPGIIFAAWGLHTAASAFLKYHGNCDRYQAHAWYRSRGWPVEPLLKVAAALGPLVELRLDHDKYVCVTLSMSLLIGRLLVPPLSSTAVATAFGKRHCTIAAPAVVLACYSCH